jgi:hypothetical protein
MVNWQVNSKVGLLAVHQINPKARWQRILTSFKKYIFS